MMSSGVGILVTRLQLETAGVGIEGLKKACARGSIRPAGRGHYYYNQLPNAWKAKIRSALWGGLEPEEWQARQDSEQLAQASQGGFEASIRQALERDYVRYTSIYTQAGVATGKARELAKGAAALEAIAHQLRLLGKNIRALKLIAAAAQSVATLKVPYLPTNSRVLQAKLRELADGRPITEVVRLPRAGNANALRHAGNKELVALALTLRAHKANFTNSYIMRHLSVICAQQGWKEPSEGWYKTLFARPESKWLTAPTRHNQGSRHSQPYTGYISTRSALFAGDCWQVDGTRVNLVAHKAAEGGKKVAGRAQQSLYMIVVRDVHSGMLLGIHLDYTEDRWGWISAIRMAVQQAGYLPYELVIDRFPGHNTAEFRQVETGLQAYGTKVTYAKFATGKAQIERCFGTIQTVFEQASAAYYGQGVKSSTAYAHRTEDYLKAVTKASALENWDFRRAVSETIQILYSYNATPAVVYSKRKGASILSPQQMHEASEKPAVTWTFPQHHARCFGVARQATLKSGYLLVEVNREQVRLAVNGQAQLKEGDHTHFVRHHTGRVFDIYLEADCSGGWIYEPGTERCAGRLEAETGILVHGPSAELGKLSAKKAELKALGAARQAEMDRMREKAAPFTEAYAPVRMLSAAELDSSEEVLLMPRTSTKAAQEAAETRQLARSNAWLEDLARREARLKDIRFDSDI